MSKWYEAISEEPSNIIYSRIRLARNWNEYVFPSRLDEAGSRELVDGLRDGLKDIGEKTGTPDLKPLRSGKDLCPGPVSVRR